jgi:hypothetical protein
MALRQDWKEFIELLNSHHVEYVLVGAFAVSYHATPRNTGDIDFLIRPTVENAERMLLVLQQFGFGSLGITVEDLIKPGQFVQLGYVPGRIDLLNQISGVETEAIWEHRVHGTLQGLSVAYIGRAELIANKRATGRGKDIDDLKAMGERLK